MKRSSDFYSISRDVSEYTAQVRKKEQIPTSALQQHEVTVKSDERLKLRANSSTSPISGE